MLIWLLLILMKHNHKKAYFMHQKLRSCLCIQHWELSNVLNFYWEKSVYLRINVIRDDERNIKKIMLLILMSLHTTIVVSRMYSMFLNKNNAPSIQIWWFDIVSSLLAVCSLLHYSTKYFTYHINRVKRDD